MHNSIHVEHVNRASEKFKVNLRVEKRGNASLCMVDSFYFHPYILAILKAQKTCQKAKSTNIPLNE